MNKSALALAIAVSAAAAVAPGSPVAAQAHAAGIQRCAAPDGTTLYTDQPCAAHQAEPMPMPGELAARLVDARQAELAAGGTRPGAGADGGYVDASLPLAPRALQPAGQSVAAARRSPADGCARSPTQLAMDLQGAFALGDVNRIAESYHWAGMAHGPAMQVMQRLERLARSTLVDTRYHDATILSSGIGTWADAGASLAAGGSAGIMQLTLGGEGGAAVLDLEVERYDGCYFVHF